MKTELRGFTNGLDGVGVRKKDKSKVPPVSGLSIWTVEFPCVELEKTVGGGSFCVFLCQSLGGQGPAPFRLFVMPLGSLNWHFGGRGDVEEESECHDSYVLKRNVHRS